MSGLECFVFPTCGDHDDVSESIAASVRGRPVHRPAVHGAKRRGPIDDRGRHRRRCVRPDESGRTRRNCGRPQRRHQCGIGRRPPTQRALFLVINLAPGVYSVEVTLSGFRPYKRDNVIVEVGRTTTLDVGLGRRRSGRDGAGHGRSPIINTEQSDFSTNINQTTIANLPTNTRRWSTFALMTPGAAPDGTFGLVSFRGISGLLNSNTVDGGDNTQAFFAEERGRTRLAYSVSADAVREFQVTTSNYSAEYGRAAGGVVNAVTKSGTNELHGSGFYFLRDNKWGATNPVPDADVFDERREHRRSAEAEGSPAAVRRHDRRADPEGQACSSSSATTSRRAISPALRRRAIRPSFFAPFRPRSSPRSQTRGITPAQQADGLTFLQGLTGVVPRTGDQTLFLPKVDCELQQQPLTRGHLQPAALGLARRRADGGGRVNRGVESWGNDGVNDDWTTARFNSVLGIANDQRSANSSGAATSSSRAVRSRRRASRCRPLGRTPAGRHFRRRQPRFGKPNFLERTLVSRRATNRPRRRVHDLERLAHLIRSARTSAACPTTWTACSRKRGAYATAAASTSSPTTRPCLQAAPTRNYTSFNQGIGPTGVQVPHVGLSTCSFRTPGTSIPETTLNLGLRYDYEKMPEPQIAELAAARDVGLPEATGTISGRASAWRTTSAAVGAPSSAVDTACSTAASSTRRSRTRSRTSGRPSGQFSLQLQTTSAGAPSFPNVLASASATPVRPDVVVFADDMQNPMVHEWDAIVRAAARRRARWCRCPTSAAPAATCRSSSTRTFRQPSGTVTYAAIGGPFDGQTITTPIFTGARPDANFGRITTVSHLVDSKYNGSGAAGESPAEQADCSSRPATPKRARPTTARARRPSPRPTTC